MASFASSATTCGACKHAWTKISLTKKYTGKKKFDQQKIYSEILWPPKNVVNKFWLKKMLVEIVFGWKKLLVEIFFIAENEYWSSIFCRFFVLFCSGAEAWTNPSPWSILSTLIAFHWLRGYPESLFCHSPTLPNSTQVGVTRFLVCDPPHPQLNSMLLLLFKSAVSSNITQTHHIK